MLRAALRAVAGRQASAGTERLAVLPAAVALLVAAVLPAESAALAVVVHRAPAASSSWLLR